MTSLTSRPTELIEASPRVLLGLMGGVLLLSLLSLELSRREAGIATVWLSNGFAVGVLIWLKDLWRPRVWFAVALGLLLARWLAGDSAGRVLLISSLNLLEIAPVVAALRRRSVGLSDPGGLILNARRGAIAGLLSCAAVAPLFSLTLSLLGEQRVSFASASAVVFSAHAVGLVTAASLVSAMIALRGRLLGRAGRRSAFALRWLLLMTTLVAVLAQQTYPLLFLPLLPLAWLAFGHGVAGAVMGVLGIAVAASAASILRLGPFQLVPESEFLWRSLLPQIYVLAACGLALPLGLMVTERRRLLEALRGREQLYRTLAERTRDLVVRIGPDGGRRYVSPSSLSLLGYSPETLLQPRWELVHPEDQPKLRDLLGRLFSEGGTAQVEFRIRHEQGHWVWLEALAERVPDASGEGWEVVYSGRDISARIEAEAALKAQARTDPLTGLANRREFEERLDRALARARRYGEPLAVLALDLDHFKQINDSLGHAAGDTALFEFGQRIRDSVYEVDLVARLGGDEFVVLMEHVSAPENCEAAAQKLLQRMAEPVRLGPVERRMGTSIGIAYSEKGDTHALELLATADAALYECKRGGRGRYVLLNVESKPDALGQE
ncbi:diguanylate cyclase domain-containing protein [Aquimonas voraii]|uniref:PAS domain S-box-containing protein/diguanylate cyclase (GGDEF) domain-containing protein n=1 Tax=Aquimonas voraii TaxID=265719 RepID=A0A1G6W7K8_9GAMM|nr:diguanylate cyclase [Aquimonas voraii]SDD61930.1 PAS domain S-box-containing protein/diguanylate cyclase (GGDEF) domain-containing protein [Aquimonas voraii]